jgi:isopentenyl-diphosphate delta-isomerase
MEFCFGIPKFCVFEKINFLFVLDVMVRNLDLKRKQDHISINLNKDVQSKIKSGFERIEFVHNALPNLDYLEIDIKTTFLGKTLEAPLIISSMTGGTDHAKIINQRLASAAQEAGIGIALGSMRVLLENSEILHTFSIRDIAPDILLMANIGAVQLNYGTTAKDCQRLVDLIKADALILHLNVLQELVQPEGNKNWKNILLKIKEVVEYLSVPVIVKEVGYGISQKVAQELIDIGIAVIDIGGSGGTSWSQVESYRAKNQIQKRIAESFINWGIPTLDSLLMVRSISNEIPVIASGGIKSGIDGAKAIRMGANIFALAQSFLKAANISDEAICNEIKLIIEQLKISMCCTGAITLSHLKTVEIVEK